MSAVTTPQPGFPCHSASNLPNITSVPYGGKATSAEGRCGPALELPFKYRSAPSLNRFPVAGKCALRPLVKEKPYGLPVAPVPLSSVDISFLLPVGSMEGDADRGASRRRCNQRRRPPCVVRKELGGDVYMSDACRW